MRLMISYRREDTGPVTGRICDRLRARFGDEMVYMDIDSNPIGVDYRAHIDESLKQCDILLAIIGPRWLGPGDGGARRIDDPTDLVRLEVARALTRSIRVVPLMIDNTEMPSPEDLPEELRGIRFRQAFRIDSGVDFHHHLNRLCAAIEAAAAQAANTSSVATPTSLPPAPEPNDQGETRDNAPAAPARPPSAWAAPLMGSPPPIPPAPTATSIAHNRRPPDEARPVPSVVIPNRQRNAPPISKPAIFSLICSLLGLFIPFAIAGVICGHYARKEMSQNPALAGHGLATTGLILGYLWLAVDAFLMIGQFVARLE